MPIKKLLPLRMCCVFLALCLNLAAAFALPGVKDYVPTYSGQYVYYRDYSFPQETHIGFLQYDELTYAVRYYSPMATQGSSSIEILFSLKPNIDTVDLAGERILSAVTPEDVDTVNYLHDLMYELSQRRKAVNDRNFANTVRSSEDLAQFGGQVTMVYDFYVPIFNLRRILKADGTPLFDLDCMGALEDSADPGFSEFSPAPSPIKTVVQTYDFKQKPRDNTIKLDSIQITVSEEWTQNMDNVWMLGEAALLVIDTIKFEPGTFADKTFTPQDYFLRIFSLGNTENLILIPQMKITKTADKLVLENQFYSPTAKTLTRDIKTLIAINKDTYALIALTVYDPIYQKNKAVFDAILGSIIVEKQQGSR